MRTLVAVLLGALVAAGGWTMTADLFRRPVFSRRNVRGVDVPVGVDEPPVAGATHAGSFWTMARIRRS